jgi:SPP1 gp7 family putative phage head morphogenesis protein
MRRLVLEALPEEWHVPIRLDGPTMGPFKGLSSVRLRMAREAENLPLESIGEQVLRHARDQAVKVVGITNADIVLGSQVNAWRRENVRLITRLTTEKLDEIQKLLDAYDGVRVEELTQALTGLLDGNESRAELIARDQTLKLNADLAQTAQTSAGVTHYRWSTSGDGTVRDMHDELEGTEHSWDDPPVTDKYGNRNHPGEDYQCRCVAVPILDEYDSPGIGPAIDD